MPPAVPEPSAPRRASLRALSARAGSAAVRLALLVGLSAACAWLLTPGALTQRLPGDEALGTAALATYTATRDHDIVDDDATRAAKDAAYAAERPVYDFDAGAAEETARRIHDTFSLARDLAPRGARPLPGRDAAELRRLNDAQRDAFEARLGVPVGDADFAALAAAGFGDPLEARLVELVTPGLSGYVVEDPRALAALPDHERGVVARGVRGGEPAGERVLLDLETLRSVHIVRDEALSAAALSAGLSPSVRLALGHLAAALLKPTLSFDLAETARRRSEAAERVGPVVVHLRRGERIVSEGEVITRRHLVLFRGVRAQTRAEDVLLVRLGAGGLVLLLALLLWRYGRRNVEAFRPTLRDAVLLAAAMLASAGLGAGGLALGDALHHRVARVPPEAFFHLVPFAAGTLVVRSVLPAPVALLFAVASGAAVGLVAGGSVLVLLHATLTSVLAAGLVVRLRDRRGLFRVGLAVGAVGALLAIATRLFTGRGLDEAAPVAAAALLSGAVILPVVARATLPLAQRAFGYLTDLRLLDLASLNHPAMKDLIIQAPGTYRHAVVMGTLAEAAARAVGANPLLARVGAYYHDLGKIRSPLSFSENQRGDNPHDALGPAASALLVRRHVSDGVELARNLRLPREVLEIIQQHHGTRPVSFFLAKAQARAREDHTAPPVEEEAFRYPGPRPSSREAALVMIADVCEASARNLVEPTRDAVEGLVRKRIDELFAEGQLEDCALTLRDLARARDAVAGALLAVGEGRARPSSSGEPGALPLAPPDRAAGRLQVVSGEPKTP